MPAVVVRKAPRSARCDSKRVERLANRMLAALGLEHAELSILLTDDVTIHELNRQHRRRDKPTDVLAFPMRDGADPRGFGAPDLLGDVVVSIDTALRQAQNRRHDLIDEVTHLLAHGLLHLVGYDHQTDAEERVMNAETARLVTAAQATKGRK